MRKEYLRVEEIAITRLNNAEYIGLMQRVLKRLPRKQSSSGGSEEDGPQVQSAEPRTGEVVDELYIDAELVEEEGVTSALLDIGGNVQAVGSRPDGSDWRLGLRNPFGEGNIGVLSVSDCAVVTSGNYERYFVGENGQVYGHIIDPETGHPVDNLRS